MVAAKIVRGQIVTGKARHANTRYQVLSVHHDGTVTVRALFKADSEGRDITGPLGHEYRCRAESLVPFDGPVAV